MKNVMLLCALFGALTVSVSTRAADTAELQVKGSVRPSACLFSLAADGVVDYGRIPASQLSDTKITSLGSKLVNYSITCPNGAARVALQITDNRNASIVKGMAYETTKYSGDKAAFGLGIVNGKTIGIYLVSMRSPATVANGAGVISVSTDEGKNWGTNGESGRQVQTGSWYSWAATVYNATPMALETVNGTLSVVAVIDKLGNIPTGNDIPLDGLATLELRYL